MMTCPYCKMPMEPLDHGYCTYCKRYCGCSFAPVSNNDYCGAHRPKYGKKTEAALSEKGSK